MHMRAKSLWCGLLTATASCAYSYSAGALNQLALGTTKQQFVSTYTQKAMQAPVARASKLVEGDTIDVLTMPIQSPDRKTADYWFVFRNGRLTQWGRPEDWKNVAATYQIDLGALQGVRPP
jgi:hypothetical protein